MAAAKVSATYELLEGVLVHLPIQDIMAAKSVSKHWKEVIESSLPLNKAVFLTCDVPEYARMGLAAPIHDWDIDTPMSPLEYSQFRVLPLFTNIPSWNTTLRRQPWKSFIASHQDEDYDWDGNILEREWTAVFLSLPTSQANAQLPGSAYRAMHLTQPSCVSARFELAGHRANKAKMLQNPGGITLGQTLDELHMLLRVHGVDANEERRFAKVVMRCVSYGKLKDRL